MESFQGTIGTVSSGTLRTADLIAALSDELANIEPNDIVLSVNRALILKAKACSQMSSGADDELVEWSIRTQGDPNQPSWLMLELMERLNDHAPEGYYFGSHEGDGADYGFWQMEDYDG